MRFDDGQGDKEVEVGTEMIGPQHLPELERLLEGELALEGAE